MKKDELLLKLQEKSSFQIALYFILTFGVYGTHYIQRQTKIIGTYINNPKHLKRLAWAAKCSTYCFVTLILVSVLVIIAHFKPLDSTISQFIIASLGNNPLKSVEIFETSSVMVAALIQLTIMINISLAVGWRQKSKEHLSEVFGLEDGFFNKYFLIWLGSFYFQHKIRQIYYPQHIKKESLQSKLKEGGQKKNKTTYRVLLFIALATALTGAIKLYQSLIEQNITLQELAGTWECTTKQDAKNYSIKGTTFGSYDIQHMSIEINHFHEISPVDEPHKKVVVNLKSREHFTFDDSKITITNREFKENNIIRDDNPFIDAYNFRWQVARSYFRSTKSQQIKKQGKVL